jgi:hypothetical protein
METLITYIGLDVHKNTIAVAVAASGLRKEVRDYGTISNTPAAVWVLIASGLSLWSAGVDTSTPALASRAEV